MPGAPLPGASPPPGIGAAQDAPSEAPSAPARPRPRSAQPSAAPSRRRAADAGPEARSCGRACFPAAASPCAAPARRIAAPRAAPPALGALRWIYEWGEEATCRRRRRVLTARSPAPRSSGCRESVVPAPEDLLLLRCRRRGEAAAPGLGAAGEPGAARVSERARPEPRRAPGLCASRPFGGQCPGESVGVSGPSGGVCVCVLPLLSRTPAPRWGSWLSFPPASLPGAACPNPNHLCTRETQLLPRRAAPRGEPGAGPRRRGGRCRLLPPRRLLPSPV